MPPASRWARASRLLQRLSAAAAQDLCAQDQQAALVDLFQATGGPDWHYPLAAAVPSNYRWLNTTPQAGRPAHCFWWVPPAEPPAASHAPPLTLRSRGRRGVFCCLPISSLPPDPWSALPYAAVIDPSQPVPFPASPAAPCSVPGGVAALVLSSLNLTGVLPDLSGLGASLEVLAAAFVHHPPRLCMPLTGLLCRSWTCRVGCCCCVCVQPSRAAGAAGLIQAVAAVNTGLAGPISRLAGLPLLSTVTVEVQPAWLPLLRGLQI